MTSVASLAMWLQQDPMLNEVHVARIWLVVIALALVALVLGLLGLGIFAGLLLHKMHKLGTELQAKTMPILAKTNALMEDLSPKIKSLSENVEQLSYTVRAKVDEIGATVTQVNSTVQDINLRTRVHVARADGIVGEAMNATEDISRTVQHGIKVPLRQVVGIIAGVKVGLETLVARFPFGARRDPFDVE